MIVSCSLIEVNSVSGTKTINTPVCSVSFCHNEVPLASIKQPMTTIIHSSFRNCRVRFYTFRWTTFLETAVYNMVHKLERKKIMSSYFKIDDDLNSAVSAKTLLQQPH